MPIPEINKLHDRLFQYLKDKHLENKELTFTTRITNRFGRLDKGYWFHGNDDYIAISFWTGTDWMNKTPNINFVITEEECSLEISVWDSQNKRDFVEKYLKTKIKGLIPGGKYYKYLDDYTEKSVLSTLDRFIREDKEIIDSALKELGTNDFEGGNEIWFIELLKFQKWIDKIEYYRQQALNPNIEYVNGDIFFGIPKLQSLCIKDFPGLDACSIDRIPADTQCIFITGENGTGKTSLLKAIGVTLTLDHPILKGIKSYSVSLTLHSKSEKLVLNSMSKLPIPNKQIIGYAAYGPYRLMTGTPDIEIDFESYNTSLFHPAAMLLDIENGLNKLPGLTKEDVDDRQKIINSVIRDSIPGFRGFYPKGSIDNDATLYEIGHQTSDELSEQSESRYTDLDNIDQKPFNNTIKVNYHHLASGAKSIISMIGDLMVRLFNQQPTTVDPADLQGIVIIDEIDVHLHPIYQKLIVQQLTSTFPKIQFIISTHSPIPLLGAPDKTVVYKVMRNEYFKVDIKRVDTYIDLVKANPNLLLTSPIFGLNSLFPSAYSPSEGRMRTEDEFSEYQFNKMLEEKLKNLTRENDV